MSLNELSEKSWATIIFCKFVNKLLAYKLISLQVSGNVYHWSKFRVDSRDIFFSWNFDLLVRYFLFEVWFLTTSKKYCT